MFDAEAQWSSQCFRLHTRGQLDSSPCYCHCVVSSTKNLCSSFLPHPGIKLDISKYINNTGEGSSGCKLCSGLASIWWAGRGVVIHAVVIQSFHAIKARLSSGRCRCRCRCRLMKTLLLFFFLSMKNQHTSIHRRKIDQIEMFAIYMSLRQEFQPQFQYKHANSLH